LAVLPGRLREREGGVQSLEAYLKRKEKGTRNLEINQTGGSTFFSFSEERGRLIGCPGGNLKLASLRGPGEENLWVRGKRGLLNATLRI